MDTKILITFEGIDGSGKSTISRLVYQNLVPQIPALKYYRTKTTEFASPYVSRQMRKHVDILWPFDLGKERENPFCDEYWILLLAAWFSSMHHNLLSPAEKSGVPLVMEKWYYSMIAKLVNQGHDKEWLHSLFRAVRHPDIVVLLDIEPGLAWKRRERFAYYEMGAWTIKEGNDYTRFCQYQEAVRAELHRMAGVNKWLVVEQKEGLNAERLAAHIAECILSLL